MNEAPDDALSQCEWILGQLKAGRALTDMDCRLGFGIGRTAARIRNLREQDYQIVTEIVRVPKSNGRMARVGMYRMEGV